MFQNRQFTSLKMERKFQPVGRVAKLARVLFKLSKEGYRSSSGVPHGHVMLNLSWENTTFKACDLYQSRMPYFLFFFNEAILLVFWSCEIQCE